MKRAGVWLALLPLIAGAFVWHIFWNRYRDRFEADLSRVLPGVEMHYGGFPYRLEARTKRLQLLHRDRALFAELEAGEMQIERSPWQPDRQVMGFLRPVLHVGIAPLDGLMFDIASEGARSSLHLDGDRILRLSIVWPKPRFTFHLLPGPATADELQFHFRETPSSDEGSLSSPRHPTQAEIAAEAHGMRWKGGSPVDVDMNVQLTAAHAIRSYAIWAAGGTAEIDPLVISDAVGEVARVKATLVPDGEGRLRIAGTVETLCPATVRALAAGGSAPEEYRARRPVLIPFSGFLPGGLDLPPPEGGKPAPPVRAQIAPCPRLSGIE